MHFRPEGLAEIYRQVGYNKKYKMGLGYINSEEPIKYPVFNIKFKNVPSDPHSSYRGEYGGGKLIIILIALIYDSNTLRMTNRG